MEFFSWFMASIVWIIPFFPKSNIYPCYITDFQNILFAASFPVLSFSIHKRITGRSLQAPTFFHFSYKNMSAIKGLITEY